MRDVLRDEASKIEVSHRDAEKESVMRAPVPPRYESKSTLFNSVVEDPRFREREAEWLAMYRKHGREAGYVTSFAFFFFFFVPKMDQDDS